jgi:hypothetical protein
MSKFRDYSTEVGAGAFFALLRFRAREREAKKRARKREEKRAQKKRKRRARKKKARIRAFSSPHSENPVSEPKAAQQGESNGFE